MILTEVTCPDVARIIYKMVMKNDLLICHDHLDNKNIPRNPKFRVGCFKHIIISSNGRREDYYTIISKITAKCIYVTTTYWPRYDLDYIERKKIHTYSRCGDYVEYRGWEINADWLVFTFNPPILFDW